MNSSGPLPAPDTAADADVAALADRLRLLGASPLFRDLEPEALLELARAARLVHFAPGQELVRQGEFGEHVLLIVEGRVEVLTRSTRELASVQAVTSWLLAGDLVGELAVLDGQPRAASCIALTDTSCLEIGKAVFLEAVQRHWSLGQRLLAMLAKRLRVADALLAEHAHDPLTGLNNRRTLAEIYQREASRLRRQAATGEGATTRQLAVLFADVDRFKTINDRYGHRIGDAVLRAAARTLMAESRTSDVVARYGGDEFVVLLSDAGEGGAEAVAERIRQALTDRPPGPVPFSLSVGTAVADPADPPALDALLAEADSEMYREKARKKESWNLEVETFRA